MSHHDPEFASLAHDLSQLLWAIQGRARILAHGASPDQARDLEAIADDATAAAAMLADRDPGPCRADSVLEVAWEQARARAGADLWTLVRQGEWPTVAAPTHGLRRVLGNLLANALDAMPEGGTVTCHGESSSGRWLATVSDDGPGVPEEMIGRLFLTGATSGKADGHGLGLSGSRDLMRRYGGDLVHRPGSAGATFELELPLAAEVRDEAPEMVAEQPTTSRLLVVDDDPSVRVMLQEMLALDGHTTRLASDHDTALAEFAPGAYDAVLIDLGLPGRSGLELAGSLRAVDPAVSLILLSGWGREQELAAADADLVDETGVKPLDQPDLRALLARAAARTADRRRGDSEA